jgi:hypothetical protein
MKYSVIWWLIWNTFVLSSCRSVANDARQTARYRAACCGDVTLSLGSNHITYATGRHRDNESHDNAPFGVLC